MEYVIALDVTHLCIQQLEEEEIDKIDIMFVELEGKSGGVVNYIWLEEGFKTIFDFHKTHI